MRGISHGSFCNAAVPRSGSSSPSSGFAARPEWNRTQFICKSRLNQQACSAMWSFSVRKDLIRANNLRARYSTMVFVYNCKMDTKWLAGGWLLKTVGFVEKVCAPSAKELLFWAKGEARVSLQPWGLETWFKKTKTKHKRIKSPAPSFKVQCFLLWTQTIVKWTLHKSCVGRSQKKRCAGFEWIGLAFFQRKEHAALFCTDYLASDQFLDESVSNFHGVEWLVNFLPGVEGVDWVCELDFFSPPPPPISDFTSG